MNRRRQVGFIKTYSSKQLLLHDQPSEFSYFKLKGQREDDQEFSPYKFEAEEIQTATLPAPYKKKQLAKPPLPQRKDRLPPHPTDNLLDRVKADQLYDRIKHKIAQYEGKRSAGKEQFEQNIGDIRNKIQRIDEVLKNLKTNNDTTQSRKRLTKQPQFQGEEKQSSISESQSESEEIIITSIPSPQMHTSKQIPRTIQQPRNIEQNRAHSSEIRRNSFDGRKSSKDIQRKSKERQISNSHKKAVQKISPIKNNEENSQSDDQESQSEHLQSQNNKHSHPNHDKVITFNSRIKNQPPLYIKPYTSSSESEQNQQQDTRSPEKGLSPKGHQESQAQTQFYKNKGGVCFEVDVKQFTAPLPPQKREKTVRQTKASPIDKKAELLKRRQNAKAYDKKARRAVFSPY